MEVKFAKTRCAYFMPINKELENNVISWKKLLIEKGFKDKDPLFPAAEIKWNNNNEAQENIKGLEIKSNSTIINIFKTAFNNAGYDYLRPHSFRHTIARWAEKQTPQFFNAVRISLGHSSINTTFQSYATLTDTEVGNILKNEK